MRKLVLLLTVVFCTLHLPATEPAKGYRGFFDLNAEALFRKKYSNDRDIVYSNSGFTTTHGYQFNEHYFVGAGSGILFTTSNFDGFSGGFRLPIYALGRVDWQFGKVTLFGDLKLGTYLSSYGSYEFYITPSVGYRFSWGRKISLNIGAGISWHRSDWSDIEPSCWMPAVKLGIEF